MTRTVPAPESVFQSIQQFNADRDPKLVRLKLKRLRKTVFSFFRGTDELFGRAWPELPQREPGPVILCTGDLHVENFGACQTQSRDYRFEINDFDEALLAPASFDLVRCTASILLAGEDWKLSPLKATGIALTFLENYQRSVCAAVTSGIAGEISPRSGEGPVWELLNHTSSSAQTELLEKVTRKTPNGSRAIRRSDKKHPEVTAREQELVSEALEHVNSQSDNGHGFRVIDVTGRIAGIGSLGVKRYTVLIDGGGRPHQYRLLDVKQARPSAVAGPVQRPQPQFSSEAERVIAAQVQLQSRPALGLATVRIDGDSYRVREMIPEENRSSLNVLHEQPVQLRQAVEVVGQLVGWSQVRGANRPFGQGADERASLAEWARGPGIDAVLADAVRIADLTRRQFDEFRRDCKRHL